MIQPSIYEVEQAKGLVRAARHAPTIPVEFPGGAVWRVKGRGARRLFVATDDEVLGPMVPGHAARSIARILAN
jgi:hypothetical protein